jgi:hypothetical protein
MQEDYIKIEDHDSLVKSLKSSAIISIDDAAYETALRRRKSSKKVKQIEKDISELKTMMSIIIQKLDK